jgi:hypothetical protein
VKIEEKKYGKCRNMCLSRTRDFLADRPVHIRVETSSVWTDSGVQFGALLYGQTRENSHNHGIAEQLLRSSPNTKFLSKMVSSVRNQYDEKALL